MYNFQRQHNTVVLFCTKSHHHYHEVTRELQREGVGPAEMAWPPTDVGAAGGAAGNGANIALCCPFQANKFDLVIRTVSLKECL